MKAEVRARRAPRAFLDSPPADGHPIAARHYKPPDRTRPLASGHRTRTFHRVRHTYVPSRGGDSTRPRSPFLRACAAGFNGHASTLPCSRPGRTVRACSAIAACTVSQMGRERRWSNRTTVATDPPASLAQPTASGTNTQASGDGQRGRSQRSERGEPGQLCDGSRARWWWWRWWWGRDDGRSERTRYSCRYYELPEHEESHYLGEGFRFDRSYKGPVSTRRRAVRVAEVP